MKVPSDFSRACLRDMEERGEDWEGLGWNWEGL